MYPETTLSIVLQTPVLATALLTGFSQLQIPAISFTRDMQPHALGLRQNWTVPAIVTAATILLYFEALYPTATKNTDTLYLQHLPFSFRLKLVIQNFIGIVVVTVTHTVMRRYLRRHLEVTPNSVAQASPDTAMTFEAASRRNSVCEGVKSHMTTASADASSQMRHTTSATGEMVSLLPQKL